MRRPLTAENGSPLLSRQQVSTAKSLILLGCIAGVLRLGSAWEAWGAISGVFWMIADNGSPAGTNEAPAPERGCLECEARAPSKDINGCKASLVPRAEAWHEEKESAAHEGARDASSTGERFPGRERSFPGHSDNSGRRVPVPRVPPDRCRPTPAVHPASS
jgi:hypothetical protein